MTLKYPIPTDRRVLLAKLYFHLATTPGMSTQLVATAADTVKALIGSKKKVTIKDMRLPWKPIYTVLSQDLFLSRRQFEYTQLSWCMGYLADICQRFFHPDTIGDMLSTFTPLMNGTDLDVSLVLSYPPMFLNAHSPCHRVYSAASITC
jgi:proteasome activator subunit 4